jgi:hypothetical protein
MSARGSVAGIATASRKDGFSTGLGATAIELPRARLTEGGEKKEWQSVLIERYPVPSRSPRSDKCNLCESIPRQLL